MAFDRRTHPGYKNLTAIKAIRAFCLECMDGVETEVKLCTATKCPLFEFRFGKNPPRLKRKLTDEQKKSLVERLQKNKESSPQHRAKKA